MSEMKIKLPDDVEKKFRRLAMKRFGYQRGAMSEAATQAIIGWSNNYEETDKDFSWVSLEGALKNVKKTSVQLQHEAWDFIDEKYLNKGKKRKNARRL